MASVPLEIFPVWLVTYAAVLVITAVGTVGRIVVQFAPVFGTVLPFRNFVEFIVDIFEEVRVVIKELVVDEILVVLSATEVLKVVISFEVIEAGVVVISNNKLCCICHIELLKLMLILIMLILEFTLNPTY